MNRHSNPEVLGKDNHTTIIRNCADIISNGGVVLIPTDTVYGLSADYFNPSARQRIYQIKKRSLEKNFIILLADADSLVSFANQAIPNELLQLLPAPLTLIVKHRHEVLYQEETLAIRIPDNPFLNKLLSIIKTPIISTSANLSGEKEVNKIEELIQQFADIVDLIVVDPHLMPGQPSTILDISKKPYQVLRQGEFIVPEFLLK